METAGPFASVLFGKGHGGECWLKGWVVVSDMLSFLMSGGGAWQWQYNGQPVTRANSSSNQTRGDPA